MEELLLQYFDAFSNLYGIISMKKAYRIIEKQNPELNLTKECFAEIVNSLDMDGKFYAILSEDKVYNEDAEDCGLFDKLLIADYVLTFGDSEDYEKLVCEQADRPYYVPEKNELLKYADDFYYEKTKYFYEFEYYLRDELGLTNSEGLAEDFAGMLLIDDYNSDEVVSNLKEFSRSKFKGFANNEQAQKFFMLYINLRNHTRKHSHRGHTPFELDDCNEIDSFSIKASIPSKNGKCPCGSGKKFKRCCMGKGIYD